MSQHTKTIKVVICEDGITAKEVNPFGSTAPKYNTSITDGRAYDYLNWKQAESQRKVYKISHLCDENECAEIRESWKPSCKVKPGTTHEAIVLDDQHVKIV